MPDSGHKLFIVGAGTGGHESLTESARQVISRCRFIAAGERLLPLAQELATGAETHAIGADLEAVRDFVAASLTDADVCVLTSGDPGCFSIMPFLKESFPQAAVVEPGISAAQLLAARLAVPWTSWKFVSRHGRGGSIRGAAHETTLYFCDDINTPQAIAAELIRAAPDRPAVVAAYLGTESEEITRANLSDLAAGTFPGHALLLVTGGKDKAATGLKTTAARGEGITTASETATAPGIPDGLWLRAPGVPLAKSEMRAVLLAKAQPAGRQVIWDIGAGTGSYGVECSLLAPQAQVIALERNPAACHLIGDNAARFGARVEVVCAEAPDGLETLATPDLVIIGGSGGLLGPIFKTALRALAPGGRILVTALLEETKSAAHKLFAESGLTGRAATRVSIARGKAHDWEEHNPVIIFTGDKEA